MGTKRGSVPLHLKHRLTVQSYCPDLKTQESIIDVMEVSLY